MRTFLFILLSATCVLAAPVPKDRTGSTDHTQIVGRWRQTFPEGNNSIWVFNADGTAHIEHGTTTIVPAKFVLRPDAKPKEFDWTLTGANNGEFGGVYELTENKFRFGVRATNSKAGRPTEIVRVANNGECYEMERIAE